MKSLFACGSNSFGQLGIETDGDPCTPINVQLFGSATDSSEFLSRIRKIQGGSNHTLFLTTDGEIYGCGLNDCGQLLPNPNDEQKVIKFQQIQALDSLNNQVKFADIACGWSHSLLLTNKGKVYAFGSNDYNQCGSVDCESTLWISINHKRIFPVLVDGDIKSVACGPRHSVAIDAHGKAWGWGWNRHKQLTATVLNTIERPVKMATGNIEFKEATCGFMHTLLLSSCGRQIITLGSNKYGQLDLNVQNETVASVLCGWHSSGLLMDSGELRLLGKRFSSIGISNDLLFKSVQFGSEHFVALSVDNQCRSCGWNEHGNCGTGKTADLQPLECIKLPNDDLKVEAIFTGYAFTFVLCIKD